MYRILSFAVICCALFSCGSNNHAAAPAHTDTAAAVHTVQPTGTIANATDADQPGDTTAYQSAEVDTALISRLRWVDSLTEYYIQHSKDEMVAIARKDGDQPDWLWDALETRDGHAYISLNIGHEGEHGFTHDAWIKIDTATREIYENDVANEKLNKWNTAQ